MFSLEQNRSSGDRCGVVKVSEKRGSFWELVFSGAQAFGTVGTLLVAVWAIFFTSLPQVLENQLRTEVVEAKEEAINIRRSNDALMDNQAALKSTNKELMSSASALQNQIAGLEAQRGQLRASIATLEAERATYAGDAAHTVAAQIVALADYELALIQSVDTICARYAEYRKWLDAKRRLAELDAIVRSYPSAQQYEVSLRYRDEETRLIEVDLPDFLLEIPHPPTLEPTSKTRAFLDEYDVAILNGMHGDGEDLHKTLLSFLFAKIIRGPDVVPLSGETFVGRVKAYPMIAKLLPTEQEKVFADIDGFLKSAPNLAPMTLNVVTEDEPDAAQLVSLGKEALPHVVEFRKAFLRYLVERGWPSAEPDTSGTRK